MRGRSSAKCGTVNGPQQLRSQQLTEEIWGCEDPCSCIPMLMPLRMQHAWEGGTANASAAGASTLTSSSTSMNLAVNWRMNPQVPHLFYKAYQNPVPALSTRSSYYPRSQQRRRRAWRVISTCSSCEVPARE